MSATTALWVSILLGSCAQVFLKKGVSPRAGSGQPASYFTLLRSAWVWAWAACFVVATGLWMIAISKIEMSYAFPMLSAGYLLVAVLSIFFLKERVSFRRWTAILVITLGVAIIFVFGNA
ncbi:MAG: EamA family transporter [Acidobacteriia bacterium]|nr:EamA family transporter [Terriglobia bacterium]